MQVELHVRVEPGREAWSLKTVFAPVKGLADNRLLRDLGDHVVHQLGVDQSGRVATVVLNNYNKANDIRYTVGIRNQTNLKFGHFEGQI